MYSVLDCSASGGQDPYYVYARAIALGGDVVVALWGGRPHVGAVGIAQPRPSRRDPALRSATSSVHTLLGHSEDVVARRLSERLSAALDCTVVVVAGLHWDNLPESDLALVLAACDQCAADLLSQLGREE